MKRTLIVSLTFIACMGLRAQYKVTCAAIDGDLSVFDVVQEGKKGKKAVAIAEKNVIKTILYTGIPNSAYSSPMVREGEKEVNKKEMKTLDKMFEDGTYKNFIIDSRQTALTKGKTTKKKSLEMRVVVNHKALRQFLEREGAIRTFGF